MEISIKKISNVFSKIIDLYRSYGIDTLDFNTDLYLKFLPEHVVVRDGFDHVSLNIK